MAWTEPYWHRYGSLESWTHSQWSFPQHVFARSGGSWGSQGPETWGRWPGLPWARREERARICGAWTVWVFYAWKRYVRLNVQFEAYTTVRGSEGGSEVIQTPQQDFVFNSYSHPGLRCRWGDLTPLLQCPPGDTTSPALPLHCDLTLGNALTAFKMLRILCGKLKYFICWDH